MIGVEELREQANTHESLRLWRDEITELLDRLEAAERERDELSRDYDSEHYHRLAIERSDQALAAKLETAERELAHYKALAESRLDGAIEANQRADALAAHVDQDAKRLDWLEKQARKSRTGISFDWVPVCEGEPSGFRFMRHHFIGDQAKTLREAIDRVMSTDHE